MLNWSRDFFGPTFKDLTFAAKNIERDCYALIDQLERGLEAAGPVLKTSKSSDECFAAYSRLLAGFNSLVAQLELPRKQLQDRYSAEVVDRRLDLEALYSRLAADFPESKPIYRNLRSKSRRIRRELGEWDLSVPLADLLSSAVHGHRDELLVQIQCHKMMEEQFPEQRDLILVERNFATKHLMLSASLRVGVASSKAVRLGDSNQASSAIPPEISTIIFSHCDLESCVTLRQVNRSWYSAFQQCESALEAKLHERNPWMFPEAGMMNSYAKCALVYVKRLSGGKWGTVQRLVDLEKLKPGLTPVQQVLARELKSTEKEPCNTFHTEQGTVSHAHGIHHLKKYTNDKGQLVMILENGMQMTLPARFTEQHTRVGSVGYRRNYTVVKIQGHTVLYPSLSSGKGFGTSLACLDENWYNGQYRSEYRYHSIGGLHSLYKRRRGLKDDYWWEYKLWDARAEKFREYTSWGACHVIAVYNGLVWCLVGTNTIFPTFIDLNKSPERNVYYRFDRAVSFPHKEGTPYLHSDRLAKPKRLYQCCPYRFVTYPSEQGTLFIDLETCTVTDVLKTRLPPYYKPRDDREKQNMEIELQPPILPAIVDGRFDFRK